MDYLKKPIKKKEQIACLILKYLKESPKEIWAREAKLATRLIKIHGFDFFWCYDLPFKLNCLAFFLSQKGKEMINSEKIRQSIKIAKNEEKKFEIGEKLGDNKPINKPKSLFEFLES